MKHIDLDESYAFWSFITVKKAGFMIYNLYVLKVILNLSTLIRNIT